MILVLIQEPVSAFYISSPFGPRTHPISGDEDSFHNGIDIPADYNTPIPAVFDGQVIYADTFNGFGNTVVLSHGDETYTLYGHCSRLLVRYGDTVTQGTVIALVGSTGNSTGPHLHLSLIQNGEYIDPMTIWQER